ncbi:MULTISPECIES: TetR/AcrR family transcriptional regulator [Arthrobacter]|uniref:TetR family transcriptional regulator n=1 Tax=Arthrobacter psychrochitiniphilus TaxID=291045 RepID=A0A2V3DNI7_9MICC|nr:TetR/AcrR family transcriptional regulator [Arthrobacter psychrochitiniphilus]NYG18420.1 AcrR family transcriptional regulator [Arthrobacter psychrochitiniphilus]PXA64542.1 TetR family transcriptional regulator [Arthrobacter psychrochitiniphilus]
MAAVDADGPNTVIPDDRTEPRRQRLSPDERRQQIFECAQKLFNERAYEDVSATDIAAAAGVARGLINHYFGNKRELYLEVIKVNSTVSEVAVAKLPDGSFEERVEVAVAWFLDSLETSGASWLALGSGSIGRDPDLEKILIAAENDSIELLIDATGLAERTKNREQIRAMFRIYTQLVRSGGREWLLRKTLTRPQVHTLLASTLRVIVTEAVPAI